MTFIDVERLDSKPSVSYEGIRYLDHILPQICRHCAHWERVLDSELDYFAKGWGFCRRLLTEDDDSALVGETGPRFGCVHWSADGTE